MKSRKNQKPKLITAKQARKLVSLLKEEALPAKFRQLDIAKRAGVTPATVSAFLKGERRMLPDTRRQVCNALMFFKRKFHTKD